MALRLDCFKAIPPFNYLTASYFMLYYLLRYTMTKPRNPLFSFNVRGSLGHALTFARRHRQQIAEAFPTHRDAKTAPQLLWRTMYQQCTDLWLTLSGEEKRQWAATAARYHMGGYAYYMSLCLRPNPGIYLPLAGGTMSGNIDIATNKLINLPLAASAEEPTRKTDFEGLLSLDRVSRVVTGSHVSYVDFTSLNINIDDFYILYASLHNPQGASTNYWIFCNGDNSSPNYRAQWIRAQGVVLSASRPGNAAFSYVPNGDSTALFLFISRDANGYFRTATYHTTRATGTLEMWNRGVVKNATVLNVTSLRVQSSVANAIGSGSLLCLYRPRRL